MTFDFEIRENAHRGNIMETIGMAGDLAVWAAADKYSRRPRYQVDLRPLSVQEWDDHSQNLATICTRLDQDPYDAMKRFLNLNLAAGFEPVRLEVVRTSILRQSELMDGVPRGVARFSVVLHPKS